MQPGSRRRAVGDEEKVRRRRGGAGHTGAAARARGGAGDEVRGGSAAAELAAAVGPRPLPALVLCCVAGVRFLADPETDEVFAKIRLVPVGPGEAGFREPEGLGGDPAEARDTLDSSWLGRSSDHLRTAQLVAASSKACRTPNRL